jgi:RimJ/RimL family protein N-acetyltransferase
VPISGVSGVIERLTELPTGEFAALVDESERAGWQFVRRLADEWASGRNRFDGPGEALFAALLDGAVIGVCGLNIDPYAITPSIGRVRHLYVRSAHRERGVAWRLVRAVVDAAEGRFHTLRLSTSNPAAARLYESLGFRACTGLERCTHLMALRSPGGRAD